MDDGIVRELMTSVNCAVCGQRYQKGNVDVLYHQQELWFISVFCQSCQTKGLVAALIKESGEAQLVTDLTEEEMARFIESPAVTADDILDLHAFLKDFDGDFASLFGKSDSQG